MGCDLCSRQNLEAPKEASLSAIFSKLKECFLTLKNFLCSNVAILKTGRSDLSSRISPQISQYVRRKVGKLLRFGKVTSTNDQRLSAAAINQSQHPNYVAGLADGGGSHSLIVWIFAETTIIKSKLFK